MTLAARLQAFDALPGNPPTATLELRALDGLKPTIPNHPVDGRRGRLQSGTGFLDRHRLRLHAPSVAPNVPFDWVDSSVTDVMYVILDPSPGGQGVGMKTCTKCGEAKPLNEFWKASGSKPGALRAQCKVCLRARAKEWAQANPERSRAYTRKWATNNKDKVDAYRRAHPEIFRTSHRRWLDDNREYARQKSRDWYYANRERSIEHSRRYFKEHPEWARSVRHAHYLKHREKVLEKDRLYRQRPGVKRRIAEYGRRWRSDNIERVKANNKRWIQENRHRANEHSSQRRVRLRGGYVERVDRAQIITREQSRCWICGKRPKGSLLTLDHLWPVMHGGPHAAWNLRVACKPCNSKRGPGRIPAQLLLPGSEF